MIGLRYTANPHVCWQTSCSGKCLTPLGASTLYLQACNAFVQVSTQLYVHAAGNELLNYLKGLEADAVKSLTIVSEDGTEAMNTFIHRLLGKEHIASDQICIAERIWKVFPCGSVFVGSVGVAPPSAV